MKTNRTLKLITLTAAIFGFAATSFAQETASASAAATIVTPITIANAGNMNFGNVAVQSTTGGTVILTSAGVRSTGGDGGVTLPSTTGTVSAAKFTVTGASGYSYTVTLPGSAIVKSGANQMTVDTFTSDHTGIITGGTVTLSVGATLHVTADQPAGSYATTENFNVIVNYN
jgi:hypothetical protein